MASIIRIKRSGVSGNPTTLAAGELAYSGLTDNGSNGGDRLYIGMGTENEGNAANHVVIGGKFFTDRLDHTAGVLTASSALVVDSNKKLDELLVDDLSLNGSTLGSTVDLKINTVNGIELIGTSNKILSGPYGGTSVDFQSYELILRQDRGGAISLKIGDSGSVTSTLTFNNDGSLTVPGTINTLSNSNLTLAPNGTGKLVLNNPYVGDTSTSLAEYIYDTVGGAVTAGNGIDVTNSDAGNTTTISLNTEYAQDLVATMFAGTQSGLTATYNDTTGIITLDVNDPVITIAGDVDGNATMTNLGNTTITVTLDTVNSTVGSFGSTTAIPVITVNGKGLVTSVTTASITTSLGIAGDTGSDTIALATDTLTFAGGEGIDTVVNPSTNIVTISGEDATTSNKGIASFETNDFNITSGAVELKDTVVKSITTDSGVLTPSNHTLSILGGEGIDVTHSGTTITVLGEDATTTNKGIASFATANFSVTSGAVTTKDITLGTSTLTNGSTTSTLAGLQQLDVDNIRIDGNEILSTNTNGNISLNPNGTGVVAVNTSRITGLVDPIDPQDAATKNYVDDVAQGLSVKPAVRVATTTNLTATYNNGASGVGATLTLPAAATLTIDGINSWSIYDGILVKDQTSAFQNGRYYISTIGNISTAWVLTRCSKCDEADEIPSMYVFVQEGSVYAATGWVAIVEDFNNFDVGVDDITFQQFSGAGNYLAGDALAFGVDGRTFNVVVAAAGGIEISADALQLKSSIAGNGLTYSSGVVTVVGTANRITANADSIDIASTYVGQTSITTLGTISAGTWQGSVINPTYGGTGINNGSKTITLGGNFTHTGAHTLGLTTTANTSVTLPTTGTLATLAGTENISNKTITNSSIGSSSPSTAAFTTLAASGLVSLTNATDASAIGTAAVVLTGGLSVAKQIRVGTNITGSGAATSALDGFTIDGGTY